VYVYDFGQEIAGYGTLSVSGPAGTKSKEKEIDSERQERLRVLVQSFCGIQSSFGPMARYRTSKRARERERERAREKEREGERKKKKEEEEKEKRMHIRPLQKETFLFS
jgi:hypothetical protein